MYDVIERVDEYLGKRNYDSDIYEHFTNELNDFFVEHGIGWRLIDGHIEMRGPESFEVILQSARNTELQTGLRTASSELHQAIADLSRRPAPDPTGAIQHAIASLECVARQLTGDHQATLGKIMNDHRMLIQAPLDQAVKKTWAYASEFGRHLQEGREPSFEDAELVVGLCASISNYLIKKSNA